MRISSIATAAALVGSALLGTSGIQSAQASVNGVVHGGYPIWKRVNPFSDRAGHTVEGERLRATCKRWGANQKWWYWSLFFRDGLTGYVQGSATNIRHSRLARCS